jgi:hypothetical protein
MAATFRMTNQLWHKIQRHPKVKRAATDIARGIAHRARALEQGREHPARITVETGHRPKGRFYARVVSNDPHGEFGTAKTPRRSTLARAASGSRGRVHIG